MAKKSTSQNLSAENYIRQRARNLPIYECIINKDWEDFGMATIIIARTHVSGNITFCSYLIDLKCLGIKDTFYQFNIPEGKYEDILEQIAPTEPQKVEYALVHNIIYAAWEYADSLGFKPHKDFISITQYMLAEDTDDIPYIDIHCGGKDGKPMYVRGPNENSFQANVILAHLKQHVGEGNFKYIIPIDSWDGDDNWDDDEEDWDDDEEDDDSFGEDLDTMIRDYVKQIQNNTLEKNVSIFNELIGAFDGADKNNIEESAQRFAQIHLLYELIHEDFLDIDRYNMWSDKWQEEMSNIEISNADFNAHFLGLTNEQQFTEEDYEYLHSDIEDDELYEYINKRWGETPYLLYMKIEGTASEKKREKLLKEAIAKYPDFPLLKMRAFVLSVEKSQSDISGLDFRTIFGHRKEVSTEEFLQYQMVKYLYFSFTYDLEGSVSLMQFVLDIAQKHDLEYSLSEFILSMRMLNAFNLHHRLQNLNI